MGVNFRKHFILITGASGCVLFGVFKFLIRRTDNVGSLMEWGLALHAIADIVSGLAG
jgi:hypothetical protein